MLPRAQAGEKICMLVRAVIRDATLMTQRAMRLMRRDAQHAYLRALAVLMIIDFRLRLFFDAYAFQIAISLIRRRH